jgi:hypothetical protein
VLSDYKKVLDKETFIDIINLKLNQQLKPGESKAKVGFHQRRIFTPPVKQTVSALCLFAD